MGRKDMTTHPDIGSGRVGLIVAEMQGVHHGHRGLVSTMLGECDVSIVAFGSCEKHGILGHPFTFEQRKAMLEGVFGPQLKFVQLQDIDASIDNEAWMRYVLDRITKSGLPAPTDYFSGSAIDAKWYEDHFASVSGPGQRTGLVTTYARKIDDQPERRLHIIDRSQLGLPSGRDIRFLIERRDNEWKRFVPARLWRYIERNYPPNLRQALLCTMASLPAADSYPVGTRALASPTIVLDGGKTRSLLELKDDGEWRPVKDGPDEKTLAALRMHGLDE